MSTDLTKLLTLETVLEHLLKATPGEKLEYLSPTQRPPEDTQVHTTRRGARGYYPSEVGTTEIDDALDRLTIPPDTEEGIREEVRRLAELPEEEREIEVVTPDSSSDDTRDSAWATREQVNAQFENMYADLRDAIGEHQPFLGSSIDPADLTSENLTKAGFTDGSDEGSATDSGLGITSYANFTVEVAGKKFIFKASHDKGDNRSEMLAYSVDRALGLNLVPYVQPHSIDPERLLKVFTDTHPDHGTSVDEWGDPGGLDRAEVDKIKENSLGSQAAGHFQEFCENCLSRDDSISAVAEMLASKEGREEFLKLILLDAITGNPDRHTGNYMITADHKILAIDNGFAGRMAHSFPHDRTAHIELHEISRDVGLDFPYRYRDHLDELLTDEEKIQIRTGLEQEALDVFDKYFDEDTLSAALGAVNWEADNLDIDRFKNLYTIQVNRLMGDAVSGRAGYGYGSTPFSPDGFGWESFPVSSQPGDRDRNRDWKGADPVDDGEMGWGGDTPAHLQGGPRQGVRR